jgi:hypothetical protein
MHWFGKRYDGWIGFVDTANMHGVKRNGQHNQSAYSDYDWLYHGYSIVLPDIPGTALTFCLRIVNGNIQFTVRQPV